MALSSNVKAALVMFRIVEKVISCCYLFLATTTPWCQLTASLVSLTCAVRRGTCLSLLTLTVTWTWMITDTQTILNDSHSQRSKTIKLIKTIRRHPTTSRAQQNRPHVTNTMPVAITYKTHQHRYTRELTVHVRSAWPKSVASKVLGNMQYTSILVKHTKRKACARPAHQQCRISCAKPDSSCRALCLISSGWALGLSGSSVCTGSKQQVIEAHLKCFNMLKVWNF